MWQTVLNTIGTAALAALAAFGVAALKALGDAGVEFIEKKKDAVVAKIGADTYNHRLTVAKSIFGGVDEDFRITPKLEKTIENKQKLFAEKIKKAIPGITDSEIEQLRQAVAGEVNKGKAALTSEALAEKSSAAKAEQDSVTNALKSAADAVQAAQKAISGTDGKVTAATDKTAETAAQA